MLVDAWRQRTEIQRSIDAQRAMDLHDKQGKLRMRSMYQHIKAIDELFGDVAPSYGLTAQWDADFQAGKVPDLEAHVRRLKIPATLQKHLDQMQKPKAG